MQPRAQGSNSLASVFEDPQCRIVIGTPVVPPNAKLLYLDLRYLAGGGKGRVTTKLINLAVDIGRDRRTVLTGLRVLEECGLVRVVVKPPEGYSKATDAFWTLDVGDPAELLTARRRAYGDQKSLPDSVGQDAPTESEEVADEERDKMVPFCPASEIALSGPSEEVKSLSLSPSGPLGTFSISEPSVPLELTTSGAPESAEIAEIEQLLKAKRAAAEPPPTKTIAAVTAHRASSIEDGTHDAYYRAKRERRIREIVRRVADSKLKTVVAVKVADAECSGLLDPQETEEVLAWMDGKRKSEGLPIPSQAFVGTMKLVFSRNKIPWPIWRG